MPKIYERSVKGSRKASRELRKGDTFYVVLEMATHAMPFEDAQLYSEYKVTGDHPLLGGAMVGGISVEYIVLNHGPAFTQPPKGMRNVATPGPQVDGPLPKNDNVRPFTDYEIRQMEKQVEADKDARKPKKTWWA